MNFHEKSNDTLIQATHLPIFHRLSSPLPKTTTTTQKTMIPITQPTVGHHIQSEFIYPSRDEVERRWLKGEIIAVHPKTCEVTYEDGETCKRTKLSEMFEL